MRGYWITEGFSAKMVTSTFASVRPCMCGRAPRPSRAPNATDASPPPTSSAKPLLGELQRQVSSRVEEASKAVKKASGRLLDAFVDSTFQFTGQTLLPSESNFAPVDEIGAAVEISEIEGDIPPDFPEGVYIRNGSNPLFGALHSTASVFGTSRETWIEGEGMLHALYFTKNSPAASTEASIWSVSYNNRYVRSETFLLETARRKPCFLPAIDGNSAAILAAYILNYLRFGKVNKYISNTNVFEHAGRAYSVSESHLPQEIDVHSLDTLDDWDVGGAWDRPFTAHPKIAPGSGELVIFGVDATKPFLVIGVVSADGKNLKHKVDLKLDRSPICHDVGVTLMYNIIMDMPLTIDINRLIRGGPLIEFEKESYARIGVMPRYGDADSVMWFDVEPFCTFHLINCFEDGDEVVVRGFRTSESIIPAPRLGLDKSNWFSKRFGPTDNKESSKQEIHERFFSRLYQWRLNLKTSTVTGQYLTGTEFSMEFPTINNDYIGLPNKYAYAQVVHSLEISASNGNKVVAKYGGLVKLCLEDSENKTSKPGRTDLIRMQYHQLGRNQFCSGAAFVPRVGGLHEDDGWIVSFVHDEETTISQVHIIDTRRVESGPIAKITLPERVPYGFHGTFIKKQPSRDSDSHKHQGGVNT